VVDDEAQAPPHVAPPGAHARDLEQTAVARDAVEELARRAGVALVVQRPEVGDGHAHRVVLRDAVTDQVPGG
jgi:hypothetical protein